jgi:hypothetical protein
MSNETNHKGSCHCGAVTFTVTIDATRGTRCNCTICTKTAIVGNRGKLGTLAVTGEHNLSSYEFGSKVAKRYFCKTCGVQLYGAGYLAEMGGDFLSINLNVLDDIDPNLLPLGHWDGRHDNWHAGMHDQPWPIRA